VDIYDGKRPRRFQGKPTRRPDRGHRHHKVKGRIDKTTTVDIDTAEKEDDKRLASLEQLSCCEDKSTSLASYRRKGPSCIYPSEATGQIASDCKAKNDIWSSAAAHRERRPQASLKRRTSLPSRTFREVHQLLALGSRICTLVPEFHIFFCPVCGGSVTGGEKTSTLSD
jgi:hypothetical protein